MEIIKIDDGCLDSVELNGKTPRLFISIDETKVVAKTHINKQAFNFKYLNRMIWIDDLEYAIPLEVKDIILDFEPDYTLLNELKLYCCNIYLWENMLAKNILKIDNLNE